MLKPMPNLTQHHDLKPLTLYCQQANSNVELGIFITSFALKEIQLTITNMFHDQPLVCENQLHSKE